MRLGSNWVNRASPAGWTSGQSWLGLVLFVLGVAGISLGCALEWGIVLLPVQWVAFDQLVVKKEERFLRGKFGADYEQFLARTRRWL